VRAVPSRTAPEETATELGAELDAGDGADVDRRAADFANNRILNVLLSANPAHAAHDVFGVVFLDDAAAGRQIAFRNGRVELTQCQTISAQVLRPHVDLIFGDR
jgi:hypothetical protein